MRAIAGFRLYRSFFGHFWNISLKLSNNDKRAENCCCSGSCIVTRKEFKEMLLLNYQEKEKGQTKEIAYSV